MKKIMLTTVVATSLMFGGIANAAPANTYIATDSDTFWSIANTFNIPLSELIANNPNVNADNIYEGVIIKLPIKAPQKASWEVKADAIIATGMGQLGVPYVFGGSTPYVAFDCSGFVQYAFNQNGFNLLHSASLQSQSGTPVEKSNLRKGDLIFLQGTYTTGVSHVGIYLGNNQILQAGTMGTREVKISTFFGTPYYDTHYWGARRLIN
ncbi:C40 family peptidase [Paenibacillus roseipurpureus]|uniref:LysM peptidoglycan-binding domain-containing C40 family peptidase n=1 Tax=Paenibacillus roseopurpureus TaxID=2918901 RepID=A0AA96LUJ4_9BACL|nr:LysM peptidoglycan-binding domain-containing C40 family peptidase [Paenibacillus sp. MBLB1832]WNR46751.1 LysM peptidoglycan-binding domain-containing C40 family peptidase [Paenibacillus sp. MBLB1832]